MSRSLSAHLFFGIPLELEKGPPYREEGVFKGFYETTDEQKEWYGSLYWTAPNEVPEEFSQRQMIEACRLAYQSTLGSKTSGPVEAAADETEQLTDEVERLWSRLAKIDDREDFPEEE